jgi:antitoxin HicB
MAARRSFEVVLEAQEGGGFVASVPDLPGLWAQGETREQAIAMVKDAIAGYLRTLEELGRPVPRPIREGITVEA